MKSKSLIKLFCIFFLLFISSNIFSQVTSQIEKYRKDNYGNPSWRKKSLIDANQISTSFYNNGLIGYWPNSSSCAWPDIGSHYYLEGSSLLIGAEFIAPGNHSVVHSIETSYREMVDKDPKSGHLWTLEPVPGYADSNSTEPAIMDKKNTLPSSWPSVLPNVDETWNGLWYGINDKGKATADYETFFVMDDSQDKEFTQQPFNFFPVLSDTNRGGLGLRIETRGLAWRYPLIEDVIFWEYDIINISDYDYEKVIFGFFVDPGIGGVNDNYDDKANYNESEDIVYAFDNDRKPLVDRSKSGYVGIALLDTPNNPVNNNKIGLTSFFVNRSSDTSSTSSWPINDEVMWNKLQYGSFDTTVQNQNITLTMGTGPFTFLSGTKEKLVAALICENNYSYLLSNKRIAEKLYTNNYNVDSIRISVNPIINITNLDSLKVLSGIEEIRWSTNGINPITLLIIFSNNVWYYSEIDSNNTGKFVLDTRILPDDIFYRINIVSYSFPNCETITNFLTVNNEGNVPPQFMFMGPYRNDRLSNIVKVWWLAGDADQDTTLISLYYGNVNSNVWRLIEENIPTTQNDFLWDTNRLPNREDYVLKAVLSNVNDTVEVVSGVFSINNNHHPSNGKQYTLTSNTTGTGTFYISVFTPSELTKDTYSLQFLKLDDSVTIGYKVVNLSKNKTVVEPTNMVTDAEGPEFDGIRLIVNNDLKEEAIDSLTGWIAGKSNLELVPRKDNSVPTKNFYSPCDYQLTFYPQPVYTTPYVRIPTNLKIYNITKNQDVDFDIEDYDNNRQLSIGDNIIIIEYAGPKSFANARYTWRILYREPSSGSWIYPTEGDVFLLTAAKPFKEGDEIIFSTANLPVGVSDIEVIPNGYQLSQNYPNPFNPTTTIEYTIPNVETLHATSLQHVTLKVYDILGREITTLVNEYQLPGKYRIQFNVETRRGESLPSGIYFYTLKAGNFSQTNKMMLIK